MNGDGRLTAELFPDEKPQDECGVFGVFLPGEPVAQMAYYGLYALQHRGQEAAGIAVSGRETILVYKDLGLVSQVFNDEHLRTLTGDIAIGHVRYATTGGSTWENAQPTLGPTRFGTIAMAHNGNLTNTVRLMAEVKESSGADLRGELGRGSSTDTAVITALLGAPNSADSLEELALEVFPRLEGAFSLVFVDEHRLYAARDRHGFRPLVLGQLGAGWVIASESAALDIVGAEFVREIEPGEAPRYSRGWHVTFPALGRTQEVRLHLRVRLSGAPGYRNWWAFH